MFTRIICLWNSEALILDLMLTKLKVHPWTMFE
jgi:hypothetical protein